MASLPTKKKRKRIKRPDESYLQAAKQLANLVPKLKKYRKRKTLKPSEKSAIARREKQLRGVTDLHPVTKKQARKLKKKLFLPGIQAIRLRGVPEDAKIKISAKGDISLTYNKRRWIYWGLDRDTVRSKRGMKNAGRDAFNLQFPIEKVADLAKAAFKKLKVQQVNLWAHAGRVGDGFGDLQQFILWVNEKWHAGRYGRSQNEGGSSDPGLWVNGIAILLEET